MSFKVRVEPSGHVFTAYPQESLLEAALRSGINLHHSCSNGSCGDCRIRILEGQTGVHMHGDYHFSEQEKSQGYAMLCTTRADSDLVIEAREAGSPKEIPIQQIRVKVSKVEAHGDKVRILQLRTPRSKTLNFLAGQHASLHLDDLPPLDLPIASCPCNGMYLYFHLHRDHDHPLVARVFEGLLHHSELDLEGPFGTLTLDDDSRRPLLMVAVGTAFASIKSLIEHAVNLETGQPLQLFWLADTDTGHYQENYCRAWADVLDNYHYSLLVTASALPSDGEREHLLAQITDTAISLSEADIYLAGPPAFTLACRQALIGLGADAERTFVFQHRSGLITVSRQ